MMGFQPMGLSDEVTVQTITLTEALCTGSMLPAGAYG